jgi:hypothetical protein
MEQIEELLSVVFNEGRESLSFDQFSYITQSEVSDLMVNMLGVIRDCLPCTQSFWEKLKSYYKKEKKDMNSPQRTVPNPIFNTHMSSRSNSPRDNQKVKATQAAGGATGSNMLKNFAA